MTLLNKCAELERGVVAEFFQRAGELRAHPAGASKLRPA